MPLPDFPTITPEALAVITERHRASYVRELPELGMFNGIFALGDDFILRIPRNNPFPISKTYKEQVAVVAARAAGVRTPAIITFDDSLETVYDLLSRSLIKASCIIAKLEETSRSQFFQSLLHFSNQAKLRSTTQRLGMTTKL